jgi:hypothetical protein
VTNSGATNWWIFSARGPWGASSWQGIRASTDRWR